jgi:putative endonuclease
MVDKYCCERKTFGNSGEKAVEVLLVSQGYTILERQFKLHKIGEIDIIASKDNVIIFVEVKSRASDLISLGSLVTEKQKRCIIKIAFYYCQSNNIAINDIHILRFDIARFYNDTIDYYENAFSA